MRVKESYLREKQKQLGEIFAKCSDECGDGLAGKKQVRFNLAPEEIDDADSAQNDMRSNGRWLENVHQTDGCRETYLENENGGLRLRQSNAADA